MVMQRLRSIVGLGSGDPVLAAGSNPVGGGLHAGSRWGVGGTRRELKLLPTRGLVEQILDEYDVKHIIDDDGDLAVRFPEASIYFFHGGSRREVLQARLYLNRRYPVEMRPALALALDDWNRTKFFPKAYTVLPDDGLVGICGEQSYDFGLGVGRAQLKYTVGAWLQALMVFSEWVDEHVWVPEP